MENMICYTVEQILHTDSMTGYKIRGFRRVESGKNAGEFVPVE